MKSALKTLLLVVSFALPCAAQSSFLGMPSPQMSGSGTPIANGISCAVTSNANVSYIQIDATNGRLWLCDQSTGSWAWDHLISPTAVGVTGSIGGSALPSLSCSTGTATIPGAAVGVNAAFASPIVAQTSPLIHISAQVTAANTVTVTVCNLTLVSSTPIASQYRVLLF